MGTLPRWVVRRLLAEAHDWVSVAAAVARHGDAGAVTTTGRGALSRIGRDAAPSTGRERPGVPALSGDGVTHGSVRDRREDGERRSEQRRGGDGEGETS